VARSAVTLHPFLLPIDEEECANDVTHYVTPETASGWCIEGTVLKNTAARKCPSRCGSWTLP
jgi:hypothetical protein